MAKCGLRSLNESCHPTKCSAANSMGRCDTIPYAQHALCAMRSSPKVCNSMRTWCENGLMDAWRVAHGGMLRSMRMA
eukprot:290575-Chlamydomonas_euryale.AAC.1